MSKASSAEEDFIRVGDDISFYNEEHGHGFMAGPLSTKGTTLTLCFIHLLHHLQLNLRFRDVTGASTATGSAVTATYAGSSGAGVCVCVGEGGVLAANNS